MAEDGLEVAAVSSPQAYTVTQGVCFVKPGEKPDSEKIVRQKRQVGYVIHTTGQTWKGPQGGLWAEVDVARSPHESCWVAVDGPGFNVQGPLLEANEPGGSEFQRIQVRYLKDPPIFSIIMRKNATVQDLVNAFCKRTGLNKKETIFTKGLPRKAPTTGVTLPTDYTLPKDVLFNEMTIAKAGITDTLNLVYLGHYEEDYAPC
mmetsp:Transcript_10872/g.24625  ORF Transcript_10872/g.24625 Transcript_10872/m.24625 type:complete len:203 (+) Transcript_10872:71-679(+)